MQTFWMAQRNFRLSLQRRVSRSTASRFANKGAVLTGRPLRGSPDAYTNRWPCIKEAHLQNIMQFESRRPCLFIRVIAPFSLLALLLGCSGLYAACFLEGAMVSTPDGLAPIESLAVGSLVLSRDSKGLISTGTVSETFSTYVDKHLVITIGEHAILRISPEHKVATSEGWKAAHELSSGQTVVGFDDRMVVHDISENKSRARVFNICVFPYENYYCEGVLVQNKQPPSVRHSHIIACDTDHAGQNELFNRFELILNHMGYRVDKSTYGVMWGYRGNQTITIGSNRDGNIEVVARSYLRQSGRKVVERDNRKSLMNVVEAFERGLNNTFIDVNGVLFDDSKEVLVRYPHDRKDRTYIIPDGVRKIGISAFEGNEQLEIVVFPPSVTTIEQRAFKKCIALNNVQLANGLLRINDEAFRECYRLTEITVPDSVISIGQFAFYKCSQLSTVNIGNGVSSIGFRAFRRCSALTRLTLGDNVTMLSGEQFSVCDNLEYVSAKSGLIYNNFTFGRHPNMRIVYREME